MDSRDVLHPLLQIEAVLPPWLEVLLFYYLTVVIAGWARGRIAERRGMLLASVAMLVAALLAIRATSIVYAYLLS